MSDMSTINSSTSDAIDQLVIDSGRMHKVINGTAAESVTVEDGSLIPSLRKAILDNLYYQTPILPWVNGSTTQVFNQLYAFTEVSSGAVSWWYAPSATATNPVSMKASPVTDSNWRVVLDSATLTGLYATIDSPSFTGVPLAPTVDVDDNSDSLATTKFVNALILKILQDVTMVDATATNLTVTGDANIYDLTVRTAEVTESLTVKNLTVTGDVEGILTSVDGIDIAPKSVSVVEGLEVGGNTTLQGTFQLKDNTIILGDGTVVDLTNIGTATNISPSANLNQETGNKNFIWNASTLNSPILGSSGKGVAISRSATEVTQVTWPDGEPTPWVRFLSAGTWTAWESSIADEATAVAGTATTVSVSPAGVKAFIAQYGIATDDVQSVTDLNTVTLGCVFNYDVGATNAPTILTGGRGILLPASQLNATMLVIENANNQMFLRYNTLGSWSDWVEFEGKEGPQGPIGVIGPQGMSAYEIYVETVPEEETPMTEEEWLASLQGSSFTVNESGVTAERAQYDDEAKGFAFLDTTTGLLYIKNSATTADWSDGIPFKGEQGTPGVNGSTWYSGATEPATSTGVNGDFYLKTDTDDVYKKTAGAWAIVTNIKGSTGDDGDAGADGATWSSGTTVPSTADGKDGDFYLKIDTLDVYKKTGTAWAIIANLKGTPGEDGAAGEQGATWTVGQVVPDDATGRDGDLFLMLLPSATEVTNGDIYQHTAGTWEWVGNIRGPAGEDGGGSGGDGAKWYNGTTVPPSSLGSNGDYYLQLTTVSTDAGNGDVYTKSSSAWTKQGNIKGSDGTTYTLPIASATVLGGVKVGSGLAVAADGTLSATGGASVTFATTEQAQAATSTTVVMSPARVREFMEKHGFTAAFTTLATDLNLVVTGDLFNYSDTTLNRPGTGGYGRGICIPSGTGYVTQLAIENDSNLMFIRYQTGGTWSAWVAVGGGSGTLPIATASVLGGVKIGTGVTVAADGTISVTGGGASVMKPSGTGHAAGLAPDPGATAGTTKFLREDATWAVPAGGSGGGSTTFTSALMADMNLVGGGSATSSFVSSGVAIDPTKIYKISAVLLLRTGAGNTVNLKLDGVGPDMFGMSIQYANASGVAAMARSEQATSNVTMTLPADVSVILLDGTMHSSYYGPNGPQVVLSTGSSGWGALLKGSCWTLTPVGTYPST